MSAIGAQLFPGRLALRPKEAAIALGVSERTLRIWMRDEGLPFARVGGVVLIPRGELEHWIANRVALGERIDCLVDEMLAEL